MSSVFVPLATSRDARSTTVVAAAGATGVAAGNPVAVGHSEACATGAAGVLVASSVAKVVCLVT